MSKHKQQEDRPEHRLDFFRPNQMVCLVTHEDEDDVIDVHQRDRLKDEVLEKWRKEFEGLLSKSTWSFAENWPIRSYTFPAVVVDESRPVPDQHLAEEISGAFSIICCTVKNNENPAETNEERIKAKESLLDLIGSLNEQVQSSEIKPGGLKVRGLFPNWLATTSPPNNSNSGGTGGPGGRPAPYTPYDEDPEQIPFYFNNLILQLEGANKSETNVYGDGEGVDVIILDTAPCAPDLVLAHKELVLVPEKQGKRGHPLIKKLLGPGGRLKVYHATYEEHLRMGNTSLNKHGYKMEDHGLFIAGIIHSIVPNATIHLIEVLNQFGVGDLESIAGGFAKAYAICCESGRKCVVNCSLCLDLPDTKEVYAYRATNDETIQDIEKNFEKYLRQQMLANIEQMKAKPENQDKRSEDILFWVFALAVMCGRLSRSGWQIVAAAGNDSQKVNGERNARGARYPAAFTKALGVGALPRDATPDTNGQYEASSFSNLADKPAQTGIMALGGEEGENNGVLGIYLGEFPLSDAEVAQNTVTGWDKPGKKSKNGFGWWSGTSFATPILTGAIASVLTKAASPATTQRALQILYNECIIEQKMTPQEEDGMPSSLVQDVPPPGKWTYA